jgi:hypothetical protein
MADLTRQYLYVRGIVYIVVFIYFANTSLVISHGMFDMVKSF